MKPLKELKTAELKTFAKELVTERKIKEALDLLASHDKLTDDNTLRMFKAQYEENRKQEQTGVETKEKNEADLNKISLSLLEYIDSLGDQPAGKPDPATNKLKKPFYIAAALLVALLGGWGIMQITKPADKLSMTDEKIENSARADITANPANPATPVDTEKTIITPPVIKPPAINYDSLELGMEFGGGIIFYLDPNPTADRHGLVMSPIDMPQGEVYWLNNDKRPAKTGATRTKIYSGKENTKDIVKNFGDGDYPAKLCDKYDFRDFDDWYLPSKLELEKLYEYSKMNPNTFAKAYYWSSTEISDSKKDVYYKNFRTGELYERLPKQNNYTNQNKARVRAIRSF